MCTHRLRSMLAVLLLGFAACDAPLDPVATEVTTPARSEGAVISRLSVPQLVGLIDFQRGLSALVGVAPGEAAAVCDDPDFAPYDLSEVLDVLKPTGANKVTIKDAEQQIVVWQGVPQPGERISCAFRTATPLAVGSVRSTYADNNLFGAPAPGAVPFHYRATGTLTNPVTGQRYQATVKFAGRITADGGFVPEDDVIHLAPVGGS